MQISKERIIIWLKQQSKISIHLLKLSYLFNMIYVVIVILHHAILAQQIQLVFIEKESQILYIMYSLCFVMKSIIYVIIKHFNYEYSQAVKNSIRSQIINKFTSLNYNELSKQTETNTTGSHLSLLIDHVENLKEYYNQYVPQLFTNITFICFIFFIIFFINWLSSIILLLCSMIMILFIILIGYQTEKKNKKYFKILSILSGLFLNRIKNIEIIRLFNFPKITIIKLIKYIEDFRIKNLEILKIAFLTSSILDFFTSISFAFIAMYFSFSYLSLIHLPIKNITILNSFFILILIAEYFQHFNNLGLLYHTKARAIGAADLIIQFLENKKYILQGKKILILHNQKHIFIYAKNLIVKDHFKNILIGPISFQIHYGQCIILTGPSGCGKSTLLNVLLGFISYEGILKINNIDFKLLNLSYWYHIISWVRQNPILPAPTIKENLFFNNNLDTQHINNIMRILGIQSFIKKFPQGLDTIININTNFLSIGQIQRIAIARALIKPHKLLLLDEPTSNIDLFSEQKIIHALHNTILNTSIICTHKIDNIKDAHFIWFMNKGKIIKKMLL
ncbi:ATP-binding cassette domain-containing protein [Enterobacteriaceae endosymbiont of Macroplea appendiculata]|uniref:ATP-binding cassette domain-containing protein n=1 Tax=Enterobacteriaceae endosymbiont of Macroplea appendiculata TaxID=2675790 RepID=UPI001449D31C|nr:ATP-binding cassette domain-containing protein [Enterobacteriaceae endosymbiont of Macroplea appendiculata]QJC31020.1 ATP-binding cassette domain-containing protein [Enterobacteriaceae endosymbiont of Macroplea appendiculata]